MCISPSTHSPNRLLAASASYQTGCKVIPRGRLSTIGPIGFGSVLQPVWQLAQTRPGVIPPGGLSASFLFCCPSGNSRRPGLAPFPRVAYRLRSCSAARLATRADPPWRHSPGRLIGFGSVLQPVWRHPQSRQGVFPPSGLSASASFCSPSGNSRRPGRASFPRAAYRLRSCSAARLARGRPGSGKGVFPARGLSGWRGACLAQGKAQGPAWLRHGRLSGAGPIRMARGLPGSGKGAGFVAYAAFSKHRQSPAKPTPGRPGGSPRNWGFSQAARSIRGFGPQSIFNPTRPSRHKPKWRTFL